LAYCGNDVCGFENRVDAVIEQISDIRKDFDFQDVDSPNVKQFLDSNLQPLTDMNFTELEQQRTYHEKSSTYWNLLPPPSIEKHFKVMFYATFGAS
jgi:hypothetical protein